MCGAAFQGRRRCRLSAFLLFSERGLPCVHLLLQVTLGSFDRSPLLLTTNRCCCVRPAVACDSCSARRLHPPTAAKNAPEWCRKVRAKPISPHNKVKAVSYSLPRGMATSTQEEIQARIELMLAKKDPYDPAFNNCQHCTSWRGVWPGIPHPTATYHTVARGMTPCHQRPLLSPVSYSMRRCLRADVVTRYERSLEAWVSVFCSRCSLDTRHVRYSLHVDGGVAV